MLAQRTNCPVCQTPVPEDARFCPACGSKLEPGDTVRAALPAHETTHAPVTIGQAAPRWFGLAPPTLLLVIALAAAVVAVVLLVLGNVVAGLLVLGLALLLAAAFLEAGRRKPDTPAVKSSVEAVDSLRARAGFAAHSWRTRSTARRDVLRRRSELMRLASERERLVYALGDAAYRGEDETGLRGQIRAVDEQIRRLEAEIAEIAADAQRQVSERRLEVQPTEVVRPTGDD